MPNAFPIEFRRDVVAVARKGEAPLSQIAKDFGISESCLHRWLKLGRDTVRIEFAKFLDAIDQAVPADLVSENPDRIDREATAALERTTSCADRHSGTVTPRSASPTC